MFQGGCAQARRQGYKSRICSKSLIVRNYVCQDIVLTYMSVGAIF